MRLFTETKTMKLHILLLALLFSPKVVADETAGNVKLQRKTVKIADELSEEKQLRKPRLLKAGGGGLMLDTLPWSQLQSQISGHLTGRINGNIYKDECAGEFLDFDASSQ